MTAPMPETMSPREKVARTITYNPVYGKLWEGSDPTKGHIYHLASSGDHAELARLADDLRKFEHHAVGSLKIGMDEVRRIIAACDAHAALLAENAALRTAVEIRDGHINRLIDQATEAERKLAEAVELLKQARSWAPTTGPLGDKISAFLSKEAERG